jgi:chromosomal replication initiator protein
MNYWIKAGIGKTHSDRKTKTINLIKRVCELYEISEKELKSKRRFREFVEARQICHYIMHKIYGITCSKTGEEFKKSHDTVLHSCKNIAGIMEYNKEFRNQVNNLI